MTAIGFGQNGSMNQELGRDTWLGFRNEFFIRNPRTGAAPLAADVDLIVAVVDIVVGSTQTFTVAAQPDCIRNVTMDKIDANSTVTSIKAIVRGLDPGGNPCSEMLSLVGVGTAQAVGTQPFSQIDKITAVSIGVALAGTDTVSFGVGTGLGIPVRIKEEGDILFKREAATQDTTGVITVNSNGWAIWVPASVPNAARTYFATVASTYGTIG